MNLLAVIDVLTTTAAIDHLKNNTIRVTRSIFAPPVGETDTGGTKTQIRVLVNQKMPDKQTSNQDPPSINGDRSGSQSHPCFRYSP